MHRTKELGMRAPGGGEEELVLLRHDERADLAGEGPERLVRIER